MSLMLLLDAQAVGGGGGDPAPNPAFVPYAAIQHNLFAMRPTREELDGFPLPTWPPRKDER